MFFLTLDDVLIAWRQKNKNKKHLNAEPNPTVSSFSDAVGDKNAVFVAGALLGVGLVGPQIQIQSG